jgi:hypothetical protein
VARWAGLAGVLAVPVLGFGLLNVVLGEELARHRQQRAPEKERGEEIAEVNKDVIPRILKAEEEALAVYKAQAELPLEKDPERRWDSRQAAQKARLAFAKRAASLRALGKQLDQAGPFNDPLPAKAMKTAQRYIAAWADLYDLLGQNVQPDVNWTPQQEKALQEQKRRVFRLLEEWQSFLQ